MILFIAFFIGLVVVGYFVRKAHDRWFMTFMGGIAGLIIALTGSIIIVVYAPRTCDGPSVQQIHLLTGSSGHFYIGSGYMRDQLTYIYFTQESDGSLAPHTVRAGLGRIYEVSTSQPTATTYLWRLDSRFQWLTWYNPSTECLVELRVPPGGVDNNFPVG